MSRRKRPKQLLRLFDGASLLQHARRRLEGIFDRRNIWVITSAGYLDFVANELPDLPRENLIGEPEGRDTSNAIGLAAHLLAQRDPDGTMAVFTADHIIRPQEAFADAIRVGLDAAERNPDSLITFGITPDCPHTGYGYVHRGDPLAPGVFRVREFREKPTQQAAEAYLHSGEYFWNSGMFVWRTATILAELKRCLPQNHDALGELARSWRTVAGTQAALTTFRALQKISIDFGVMEKSANVLVVEMKCQWQDLGSWTALAAAMPADPRGNVIVAHDHLEIDAENNIIVSEPGRLIVLMGVRDLVVVQTGDATLVCHRDQEQRLKDLVDQRQARFGERFE